MTAPGFMLLLLAIAVPVTVCFVLALRRALRAPKLLPILLSILLGLALVILFAFLLFTGFFWYVASSGAESYGLPVSAIPDSSAAPSLDEPQAQNLFPVLLTFARAPATL